MKNLDEQAQLTKKCNRCGQIKPLSAFDRDATTKTGRRNGCRECRGRKRRIRFPAAVRDAQRAIGVRGCGTCGEILPIEQFGKASRSRDGLKVSCLACSRRGLATRYRIDLEASRKKRRAYGARPGAKEKQRARALRRGDEYRRKHRAHVALQRAIERGYVVRQIACERCGDVHRVEAHHEDYDKPLLVMWLCTSCHRVRHKELKLAGIEP